MADLSNLGSLNPIEQLDIDNTYPVVKENSFRLPAKGKYHLRAPESFPDTAFSRTAKGSLQVQIDPTIVGPESEGMSIRYLKISAKPFQRGTKYVSQVGDYLRACGFVGTLSTEQEIANAVEATAGSVYEAKVDWRAYNKRTGFSVEGMERFPKNADGTYQSWIIDPQEQGKTDEEGRQLRVFANLTIPLGGFIPAA